MVKIRIHSDKLNNRTILAWCVIAIVVGCVLIFIGKTKIGKQLISGSEANYVEVTQENVVCETLRMTYTRLKTPMVEYYRKLCPTIYCEPISNEHLFCTLDGSEGFHRMFDCSIHG